MVWEGIGQFILAAPIPILCCWCACFALPAALAQSSGIGGGFLLHFDAAKRRTAAYDGRETAAGYPNVAQTLTALLDWKLAPDAALALAHYGSRNGPTELEQGHAAGALAVALERLGRRVEMHEMTSGLHLIVRAGSGQGWIGAADPRREGTARGD